MKLTTKSAEQIQDSLSRQVRFQSAFRSEKDIKSVLALGFYEPAKGKAAAAGLFLEWPSLKVVEERLSSFPSRSLFPPTDGLLSFRQVPGLMGLIKKFRVSPDVLLVEGDGQAHPKRFGVACHLGLLVHKPAVACSMDPVYGEFEEPPPGLSGGYTLIHEAGEPLGAALRTRPGAPPVFVSPGYKMNLWLAVDLVMAGVRADRIPEPIRLVRKLAGIPSKRSRTPHPRSRRARRKR
jgi:deoxyribonuclease V